MKKHLSIGLVLGFLTTLTWTAQAAVTFGASVTSANGELSTTLTWDAPGASTCTASGHSSWIGTKPASGTLQLPAITLSGTYSLTLACTFPGQTSAVLNWVAPTQNTDGTALINLAGYTIHYGRTADALSATISVNSPTAATYTVQDLESGDWFFAMRSLNTNNAESALTPVIKKTLSAASTDQQSVSLTVNPIPNPPTWQ